MSEIKKGDTVQLKSGSPMMTVRRAEPDLVWCDWIDKHGKPQEGSFPPESLKPGKNSGFFGQP
jgi:uncharacterized protein YodC (DUF2158 family)